MNMVNDEYDGHDCFGFGPLLASPPTTTYSTIHPFALISRFVVGGDANNGRKITPNTEYRTPNSEPNVAPGGVAHNG
jgi:hypothetical protein